MTKKVMKLVNRATGEMECKVCGARHFANIQPNSNGNFYRGAWQCENGCKLAEEKSSASYSQKKWGLDG